MLENLSRYEDDKAVFGDIRYGREILYRAHETRDGKEWRLIARAIDPQALRTYHAQNAYRIGKRRRVLKLETIRPKGSAPYAIWGLYLPREEEA